MWSVKLTEPINILIQSTHKIQFVHLRHGCHACPRKAGGRFHDRSRFSHGATMTTEQKLLMFSNSFPLQTQFSSAYPNLPGGVYEQN